MAPPRCNPIDFLRSVYTALCWWWGRPFIANLDLVERLWLDAPLNSPDVRMFYDEDDHSYTNYPTLADRA